MAKYEIMLILDPKSDIKEAEKLVNEVFTNAKFEKMDRTELAYEINKSKTAHYALVNVEANGEEIKEFSRKANIIKTIWRYLTINLDTEMGREAELKKPKRKIEDRPRFSKRPAYRQDARPAQADRAATTKPEKEVE